MSNAVGGSFRVVVRGQDGHERIDHADVVIDCSGTYQNHRWAGRGGIPAPGEIAVAPHIQYQLPDVLGRDKDRFINRHTLLLGCGYSAAAALLNLEKLTRTYPRTRVSWAIRRPGQALQAILNDALEPRKTLFDASLRLAQNPPAWLQFLGHCMLAQIEGHNPLSVTFNYNGTNMALTVDNIVAMVGYQPDNSIYDELHARNSFADARVFGSEAHSHAGTPTTEQALAEQSIVNPMPDFYILGAKSFGANSNFPIQVGHCQVQAVMARYARQASHQQAL